MSNTPNQESASLKTPDESSRDIIIRATGEHAPLRFVLVDLTETAQKIAAQHQTKGWVMNAIAENCIASLFLSSMIKSQGSVMVESQYSGDLSVIRGESTPMGLIRAFVRHDEIKALGDFEPALQPVNLRIKKYNEHAKVLAEGIVEMESLSTSKNLAHYLLNSEQTKNAVAIEAKFDPQDPSKLIYAVGYLLEAFPDANEKSLIIAEEIVKNLPTLESFYKNGKFELTELLDQLAGPFPYVIHREIKPAFYCPCSQERVEASIRSLGQAEVKNMIDDQEDLEIHCDYCRTPYTITTSKLEEIHQSF